MTNGRGEFAEAGFAEHAQRVLIETGRVLTESLDYEVMLHSVARLLVPELADWCVVDLVQGDRLVPAVALHREPERSQRAWELRRWYPVRPGDRAGAPRVIRTGESELYAEISDDLLEQIAQDEEHLRILRDLQLRSGVVVPLVARGHRLGAMTLISEWSNRYGPADLPVIEELGRRCGLAVDNARAYKDLQRELADHRKTQQALRQSEYRYRTLFASIDEGFCIIQMLFDDEQKPIDYRFIEMNEAFSGQTGLTDAVGRTAREMVPDLETRWFETYGRVAQTGEPTRFVDGSEAMGRWFDVYAFRIGEPQEHKVALLFSDITEQKRATHERERLLDQVQAEQERLAEIFQYAPSFMCILRGPEHVFERANDLYMRLVGKRDLIGKPVREALPEVEGQGFFEILDQVYESGEAYVGTEVRVTLQRESTNAEDRWLDFVYQPLRDADGSVTGVFAQGVDLTERKKAEVALRESERQQRARAEELAALMDSVPAVVFLAHDPAGDRITGSRYAHEFLRRPEGTNLSRSAPPSERPENFRVFQGDVELGGEQLPVQRAARGEYVRGAELEVRFDDGSVRYLFGDAVPLHDGDGQIRGALAAMIDITQRKQAEQQLADLNETLEQRVAERTDELEKQADQLRRLAVDLTRAEQRERRRLARMLHDHHQQLLVAIKMQAGMLRQADATALPQKVERVTELLDEAIESSRSLSYELSPQALYSEGLAAALHWLVPRKQDKYGLSLHVDADPTVEPVNEDARVLLFELVRELLLNVVKHADTDEAWVTMRPAKPNYPDHVELHVEDRGRGFDVQQVTGKRPALGGLGLVGMRERLAALGGELEVQSQPGYGTRVTIRVPKDAAMDMADAN